MGKRVWTIHLEDGQHTVEVERGYWSGKCRVAVDGKETTRGGGMLDDLWTGEFQVGAHRASVEVRYRGVRIVYSLFVDGKPMVVEHGARGPWLPLLVRRAYAIAPDPSDPAQLSANRLGSITDEQRAAVEESTAEAPGLWTFIGLAFAAAFPWGLIALALRFPSEGQSLLPLYLLTAFFDGGALWGFWTSLRKADLARVARLDLEDGGVEQAEGEVHWRGAHLHAQVPGRRLRWLTRRSPLPSGPYRFYFLGRSGLVLSAEPLGSQLAAAPLAAGAPPTPAERGLLEVLSYLHSFSLAELVANRHSHLGWGQRWRLLRSEVWALIWAVVFVSFAASVAASALPALRRGDAGSLAWGLVVLAFGGPIAAAAVLRSYDLLSDAVLGRVAFKDGIVAKSFKDHYGSRSSWTEYYYALDGVRFDVPKVAYDAFPEGRAYRLYYGRASGELLSLEPLPLAEIDLRAFLLPAVHAWVIGLLVIALVVEVVWTLLMALVYAFPGTGPDASELQADAVGFGAPVALLALVNIVAVIGLLRGRGWGRALAVVAAIGLILTVVGIPIAIPILIGLWRKPAAA